MTGVGAIMTEQMDGGSTANTTAYTFRGRMYTPEGTLVRHAGNGATSPMDDGVNIMLDVGVFCPCCAKTAENITVGGRMVSCNHVTSRDDTYDPVTSGDTKAQFARRLQHFKALESKSGGGDLRVDVSEPLTPREELLSFVSDLNDMFRPSEAPSPGSKRPASAADKSSLSSPRTPDSAGRSSLTYASSISESLETSLRSINELADEWGCRGEEPLRSGVPAPSRRRFPSQECMASRPLNGHVTFSDDVRRPRMNTASAADGVEMRRIGGAAYTANRHKRFSDDVTMFCYHNEASMEPPVRNAMSVSPVGTHRPGDEDTGSSSDESRALDELLAELTGTNFKKQRRTRSARDRNAGSCARPNINGVIVGAPFEDSPDGCVPNLQRQVSGQTTSSMSSPRSTATTPPIVHATRSNCEQGRACYPVACNSVGPVAMRPTTLNHMNGQEGRTITFEDDESDELREIASLSRTISSGCSNDILVEVVTNALKRSVTREYSVTRSDSPEADVDTLLEHADTEIFTGDVTLRRVFSVQRERDDSCASHARRSPFSRRSTPDQDAVSGCATCEHCGFAYGSKRRACENEASHGGLVVQQKWTIKNNTITSRRDAPVTSPSAITTREYATYVESGTRQNVGQPPRPVQDWKLETVHVESANAQKTSEPEPMSVYASMLERSLESTFEEALENVTDADSSFHEEEKPLEKPAAPTEEVDLSQYHFVTLTRPPPTSSCECIADDRSNRSINDVDTETSGTHSGGDVTTDDSDPEWAEYKGEKRGSFGQLIGDTLRMTEEILATFEHIDVEDDVVGDDSTPGDSQAAVTADTPDLLRSQSDRAVEDRVVQRTSKVESVSVSLDDPVTSVQPVNGSAKTNESEDREEHTRDATRAEGHQELRREVFVANTVADSEECFFPYLEVIPPRSPRIQKAPCIVEPSPPVEEPPKREAIFSDLVVSHVDTDAVDGVTETRSRGATPDVDHLFVQASRDVAYDSGSDVFGDMCVTTDEEPDLDALVESNTNNCAVSRTPTEQEGGVVVGDHAPEVGLAVNGNDTDEHSPNTKKKRKYVGARKRVDVTQFAQFRPVDVVKRNTDEGSARIEAQDVKLTKAETETVLTQDNNENTAQPPDTQSKLVYVNERQETIVDDVSRHVETDTTLTDDVVSAEVEERDKRREVEKGDVEMRAPAAAYTTELPESTEQPEENTAADNGWRTVLCEESSELANSACQLHRTPSPSGARYVYRASSTRGNTERFDEMKRRADIDVDKAVTAAGEGVNAEEEVVSEELDIKKVTLLFTLPKELGPVLPRRPPGSTGGKKLITIRRVTRIKADGTAEVIQAPTVQTIRYTPNDKAAITTATAAQSGEQRDATPQQSAISGHTVRPSNNADGKSQNARKTDPVPIEINMKYRHTKIRKYCKVAPLKHCAVGPPSASSAVTPSGDQNGTPDGATKEMTQALLGAEERSTDKNIGKTANGNVDQRDTRVNDDGHSLDSTNSRVSDIKVANGAETAITVTNSNVSHTATANAVFPQRSTEAPVTQNGGVAKAKQPPRVKPKPNIPSWLATQLSTETVDDGEKQEADVNDDKVTEPAAGPAMHRETTTASSVMRSFKETTL